MRGLQLSLALVFVGVLSLLVAVYYVIPGYYHVLTNSDPYKSHLTHTLVFAALGVLALIGSRFARNR